MTNYATLLKEEIARLSRKELRKELDGLKKASTSYRSEIAALKRRTVSLEKEVKRLEKRSGKPSADSTAATRVRFSAKGLASKRRGLGLSAADMGMLLGVSAQTVYNWETGKTLPRTVQLSAISAIRKMGKRACRAKLKQLEEQ